MAVDLPSAYLLDTRMGWRESWFKRLAVDEKSALALRSWTDADTGSRRFAKAGHCVLGPLDGRMTNCVWDDITLDFAALPPGAKLSVRTFAANGDDDPFPAPKQPAQLELPPPSSDFRRDHLLAFRMPDARIAAHIAGTTGAAAADADALGEDSGDHLWTPPFEFAASREPAPNGAQEEQVCFLVQSPPGRYLWLRLDLSGPGTASPSLASIRVTFPRDGLSRQLPKVFTSADNPAAQFLDRFLAIFGSIWDGIDQEVEDLPGRFLPAALGDEASLRWLAGLIALKAGATRGNPSAVAGQLHRLLEAAPLLYPARGTPAALRAWLAAALANSSGLPPERLMGFPVLIEGFCERRWVRLDLGPRGGLDTGSLWGDDLSPRLVLGGGARLGDVALGRSADPMTDALGWLASTLRVVVPACWLADEDALRRFEAALAAELPAHVSAEVKRLEPGLCLGLQSTVGVDTVIGDIPPALLGVCSGPRAGGILNYDTLLAPDRAAGKA